MAPISMTEPVVPEQGDEPGRKGKAQGADRQKEAEGGLYAEPEALLHPVVSFRAVVEAATGWKPWPKPIMVDPPNIMIRWTTPMAAMAASP